MIMVEIESAQERELLGAVASAVPTALQRPEFSSARAFSRTNQYCATEADKAGSAQLSQGCRNRALVRFSGPLIADIGIYPGGRSFGAVTR
jgi:hypothetical protein